MCICSIFVCRHKNNDMSTLLGHAHTYIPTDRQTDTQAYIHKSIQTYSYTYTWLHMCDVSPLWGGGGGGEPGGAGSYIYSYIHICKLYLCRSKARFLDTNNLCEASCLKKCLWMFLIVVLGAFEDLDLRPCYHISICKFLRYIFWGV